MADSVTERLRGFLFLAFGIGAAGFAVYVVLVPGAYTGSRQTLVIVLLALTAVAAFWGASTLLDSE